MIKIILNFIRLFFQPLESVIANMGKFSDVSVYCLDSSTVWIYVKTHVQSSRNTGMKSIHLIQYFLKVPTTDDWFS